MAEVLGMRDTIPWQQARFLTTAPEVGALPVLRNKHGDLVPEVAFLGRSNVGKSSLLNYLCERKGLVKTSSTPGKTQHLNIFVVEDKLEYKLAFVDLPGYGYARVPPSVRAAWAPMVQGYLQGRPALKVILWLFDIRRTPTDEDRQLLTWFSQSGKAVLLILTKADQVNKKHIEQRCNSIKEALGSENLYTLPVSAQARMGRQELIAVLMDAIKDEQRLDIQGDLDK
jgi:GTP-binding protein